ncbi:MULTISPECIES: succinylglutamate desuccinylase/aspartoacylase domain-containing protein [Rhizobium]|uniref:succinylglutamate desuccinylase/aspartoacylase domain-containing protein n=1 Tax=Rhizobium TaxID=379 RepID=UPI0007EB15E2|nr:MULTISPECIES: succinylglutamate desuccinylase/aspartoacylase family protein [Rhizobium]ANK89843.1 succinylglutamate desuccinylase/aspartoacylase protein [Rhizobium sp. N6212]ANK95870.1 succinylglutamate desuccinylase/aspartoacylase protein [Rhizobium sp. N621]ANL01898.1 succinylglutamate desuccinylase/aspartoacylase protein [Rhizobium esperanzae]ANL08026.1 succinylglutamate desuccinylase/aspartoacylase protein [Rhizobium sp. N1341]ANL20072.1 succinylglutamate desuccinylase/aspartoacylase pr
MDVSEIIIPGDTPGTEWRLPVLRFVGRDPKAPKAYIQAALHAGELPGTALLHFLCERLRRAESEGAVAGDITIVPQANPIGAAQSHFGELQGRFDLGSRTNFNRDFPLISATDRAMLAEDLNHYPATDQLKRQLLDMALGADLVLDLHCDDESLQYAYIDEAFWPEAADLAAALDMEAVLLSDGESSAFEEAVGFAWKYAIPGERQSRLPGKLSVTVELRGKRDVDPLTAKRDAEGLWRFLAARVIVSDDRMAPAVFAGPAVPLDNVEIIRAPEGGAVLFHRTIGDRVAEGELLATIVTRPGQPDGSIDLHAPQDGLILTRTSDRLVRRRGDLMKIVCARPSKSARKAGTLES